MKIKVEVNNGTLLSAMPNGSTFSHRGSPSKIHMKVSLTSSAHIGFIKDTNEGDRFVVVDCETGEVKAWLDCHIIPVPTILVNDK